MDYSLGVISHPDDEELAQVLEQRIRSINSSFNRPCYLEIVYIKSISSKDLLKIGKEVFFFFSEKISLIFFLYFFFSLFFY